MPQPHLACGPKKLADSLEEAEALCKQRGGNFTPLRRKVLMLLLEADRPVKAYTLLEQLGENGEAKPPTVYRSLNFLVEMGLVHRVHSLNAFVPCGHWKHGHAAVFLICEGCGSVGELTGGESLRKFRQETADVGFDVRGAVIEVRGLCKDCN